MTETKMTKREARAIMKVARKRFRAKLRLECKEGSQPNADTLEYLSIASEVDGVRISRGSLTSLLNFSVGTGRFGQMGKVYAVLGLDFNDFKHLY